MAFRVLKEFTARVGRRKVVLARPGSVVDIAHREEAKRLMGAGFIAPVELPFSNPTMTFKPMPSRMRSRRVGIFLNTSPNYSGGRVHMYQYAWCMADAGAEVFLITDRKPLWERDYPRMKNIHVLIQEKNPPPMDLDVVVTDSKAEFGGLAVAYRGQHQRAPLFAMCFEDPDWVAQFVPDYAKKLNSNKDVFHQADVLLANSGESMRHLREWLGDADKPGCVLQPAVNEFALAKSATPTPQAQARFPAHPYAVFSARGAKYKNLQLVVDAIWSLGEPFDLVVFGKPPQTAPRTSTHEMHAMSGMSDEVKFSMLRRARVTLAPSLFEGFGLVPCESIAAGTPVLCYDLPVLRDEYKGVKGIHLVAWNDAKAFKRKVRDAARKPKGEADSAAVVKRFGMAAMARRVEALPWHAQRGTRISAQLLGYWGVLSESIESVYDHVDEIVVAFGRCPEAGEIDDGSLDRVLDYPDPDGKITIERRDRWRDKKEMRQWCSDHSRGNFCLVLDGDEVWVGLENLIASGFGYGSPRWCNLWHGERHWIFDSQSLRGQRWGYPVEPFGSYCPHYRWSWWRPSYYWRHHSIPASAEGELLFTKNSDVPPKEPTTESEHVARSVPECCIYHLGHALPEGLMRAKHEFYLKRDGADEGRKRRMSAWHDWDGHAGNCGDGIVRRVEWELPSIVKRAVRSAGKLEMR